MNLLRNFSKLFNISKITKRNESNKSGVQRLTYGSSYKQQQNYFKMFSSFSSISKPIVQCKIAWKYQENNSFLKWLIMLLIDITKEEKCSMKF